MSEALGEYGAGDAEPVLEIAKPARAVEGFPEHEKKPAVGEEVERASERAPLAGEGEIGEWGVHARVTIRSQPVFQIGTQ